MWGFINVLAGISNVKSSHRDSAILAMLRKSYLQYVTRSGEADCLGDTADSWSRCHPLLVINGSRILNDVNATRVDHNSLHIGACSTRPL
ncbi:hypothetical protein PILCRDRAFT_669267 [Piloderma croceum F 1598]|uniref:Uncharacterized protein n=1 Tax=Piloderma croceum (strain F 1598) TaxID=765440 RepID=A0A0C3F761_PILCF|nr:hypothetical protein PILCRDRAFT_669267 [Piloderma croceum F 1598]